MLVFLLMSLAPGDFLTPIQAQRDVSPEHIDKMIREFGLDKPWYEQYGLWLKNIVFLNYGYSWSYKVPVTDLLAQRMPASILLSLCALFFAWGVAIPLGVLAAIYKDSVFDRVSSILAYAALSIPEFFLALLAIYFAARTGWFPIGGLTSIDYDFMGTGEKILDIAHHLALPTLVLGIGGIASIMRIMRANFLDVIRSEFVNTARAKGLAEGVVMFKHVLRNAINPLISAFGLSFSGLLSGALIIEIVMNYPGIGQLVYDAFLKEDQFVVMGAIVMSCVMLVAGNLLADLLLAWSDPRIRIESDN